MAENEKFTIQVSALLSTKTGKSSYYVELQHNGETLFNRRYTRAIDAHAYASFVCDRVGWTYTALDENPDTPAPIDPPADPPPSDAETHEWLQQHATAQSNLT